MFRLRRPGDKQTLRRAQLKVKTQSSDEGAARKVVHEGADDRVGGDPLEQRRATGDNDQADDEDSSDDGDHLLDSLLAGTDPRDMLGDMRAAVAAYAAALDDQVGATIGAFDFRS